MFITFQSSNLQEWQNLASFWLFLLFMALALFVTTVYYNEDQISKTTEKIIISLPMFAILNFLFGLYMLLPLTLFTIYIILKQRKSS